MYLAFFYIPPQIQASLVYMSCFEFRRKTHKGALKAEDAATDRKQRTIARRSAMKSAIISENRKERPHNPPGGLLDPQPNAFAAQGGAQLEAWKAILRGEDGAMIGETCRNVEALIKAVCDGGVVLPSSPDFHCQLLQVCYYTYRLLPGRAIVPVLDFFVRALKCGFPDAVRFACLTMHAAMARNGPDTACVSEASIGDGDGDVDRIRTSSATEALWMHGMDPVGIMLEAMPAQRDDVQRVMMLCIILALEAHTVARLSKVLPFMTTVLGLGHGNMLCLMAMDCIAELACTSTIEELYQLRECGVLAFYVALVAEAAEDKAQCIESALEVMAAYAEHEKCEPTAWLVAAGGLAALECLIDAPWIEEDLVLCICTILANAVLSAPEPVVSRTSLCESVALWVKDDEADEEVRMEALSVFINATVFSAYGARGGANGIDCVCCLALVEAGAFSALVAAFVTFAAPRHALKQQHILTAVLNMLDASPDQADDFAACGGIEMLKHVASTRLEDAAGHVALGILKQHFPRVFGDALVGAYKAFAAPQYALTQQKIFTAASNMLCASSPEQKGDFVACGGVDMLTHAVSVSFGDTVGHMAMRILKDHFPEVLGVL